MFCITPDPSSRCLPSSADTVTEDRALVHKQTTDPVYAYTFLFPQNSIHYLPTVIVDGEVKLV